MLEVRGSSDGGTVMVVKELGGLQFFINFKAWCFLLSKLDYM